MAPPPPPPKKPVEPEPPEDDGVSKDYFSEITIDSDYESTMTLDSGFGRERDELSDTGDVFVVPVVSPDLHSRPEPELAHIEEDDDEVMTLTSEPVPLEDATEHDADDERVTPVLFAQPELVVIKSSVSCLSGDPNSRLCLLAFSSSASVLSVSLAVIWVLSLMPVVKWAVFCIGLSVCALPVSYTHLTLPTKLSV